MGKVKIGDTIKIIKMEGEPQYTDREGVVTHIDDAGRKQFINICSELHIDMIGVHDNSIYNKTKVVFVKRVLV